MPPNGPPLDAAPHRHWAAWPLTAAHRGPSLFSRHDTARKSSRPDSKGRAADSGRTTELAALCRCPAGRAGSGQQRWFPYLLSVTWRGSSTRLLKPAATVLEQCSPQCGNRASIRAACVSRVG
ncbi:hypothetical protein MTO96_026815 [Rhipicephalus appendiculatus]